MAAANHDRPGITVEIIETSTCESGYKGIITADLCTILQVDMTKDALRSLYGYKDAPVNISTSSRFWTELRTTAAINGHDEIVGRMEKIEEESVDLMS